MRLSPSSIFRHLINAPYILIVHTGLRSHINIDVEYHPTIKYSTLLAPIDAMQEEL